MPWTEKTPQPSNFDDLSPLSSPLTGANPNKEKFVYYKNPESSSQQDKKIKNGESTDQKYIVSNFKDLQLEYFAKLEDAQERFVHIETKLKHDTEFQELFNEALADFNAQNFTAITKEDIIHYKISMKTALLNGRTIREKHLDHLQDLFKGIDRQKGFFEKYIVLYETIGRFVGAFLDELNLELSPKERFYKPSSPFQALLKAPIERIHYFSVFLDGLDYSHADRIKNIVSQIYENSGHLLTPYLREFDDSFSKPFSLDLEQKINEEIDHLSPCVEALSSFFIRYSKDVNFKEMIDDKLYVFNQQNPSLNISLTELANVHGFLKDIVNFYKKVNFATSKSDFDGLASVFEDHIDLLSQQSELQDVIQSFQHFFKTSQTSFHHVLSHRLFDLRRELAKFATADIPFTNNYVYHLISSAQNRLMDIVTKIDIFEHINLEQEMVEEFGYILQELFKKGETDSNDWHEFTADFQDIFEARLYKTNPAFKEKVDRFIALGYLNNLTQFAERKRYFVPNSLHHLRQDLSKKPNDKKLFESSLISQVKFLKEFDHHHAGPPLLAKNLETTVLKKASYVLSKHYS